MVPHVKKHHITCLLLLLALSSMSLMVEAQTRKGANAIGRSKKPEQLSGQLKKNQTKDNVGNTGKSKIAVKPIGVTQGNSQTNVGVNTGTKTEKQGSGQREKINYLDFMSWSPGGLFDTVIDGNGQKYSLGQICSDNTIRKAAWGYNKDAATQVPGKKEMHGIHEPGHEEEHIITEVPIPVCNSGYFRMFLETGCGMENYSTDFVHMNRLTVMCQVLRDISNFIESPLSTTGQRVNLWIRASSPGDPAGAGVPFYGVPRYNPYASGIADNLCWITINSGRDASEGIVSPLSYAGGGTGTVFFHASIAFNFDEVNYHSTLAPITLIPDNVGQTDLYMVALHEMLHVLGFASQIAANGESIKGGGYRYYNRYDQHLFTAAASPEPLIVRDRHACSDMYQSEFNPDIGTPLSVMAPGAGHPVCTTDPADATTCSTAIWYLGATQQRVYTPDCFQFGSSLSHFEDQCLRAGHDFFSTYPGLNPNNHYFVTSNTGHYGPYNAATNPGAMKRYPTWEERRVLCDIGYRVRTTYGDGISAPGPNWNYHEYVDEETCGTAVAGINDGLVPTGYRYITTPAVSIRINGGTLGSLLDNDNAASFRCLEVVAGLNPGFATVSATAGTSATPIDFTPYTGAPGGVYVLRYIPVSADGREGNITYVFVYVMIDNCTAEPGCDFVSDGGFEGVDALSSRLSDLRCAGEPFSESPDLFTRCGPYSAHSFPEGGWFNGEVHPFSKHDNYHFVGAAGGRDGTIFFVESIRNRLAAGLAPGTYNVSFWARLSDVTSPLPTQLQLAVSSVHPLPAVPYFMHTLPPTVTSIANFTLTQPDNEWHYYSQNFTYTGTDLPNSVISVLSPWLNPTTHPLNYIHYYGIDDISIKPVAETPTISLPPAISLCTAPAVINLNTTLLPVPGITSGMWHWYTIPLASDGTPTVSNSNIFKPADAYAASIASGGDGHVTVCYSYMRDTCEQMVCREVHITGMPFTATVTPYPVCAGTVATITCTPIAGYPTTQNYTYSGSPAVTCTTPTCDVATVTATSTTSYMVTETTSGCSISVPVIVNPELPAITGPTWVCRGSSVTMHNTYPGGTWSDTSPLITTNATTGEVTGVTTGTATITYSANVCGIDRTVTTNIQVYVHPITSSSGMFNLCMGSSITLSNVVPHGIWSSSNSAVASINPFTGVLTGGFVSTATTATITYTLECDGCSTTQEVTIHPTPNNVFGVMSVCVGETRTLANTLPGGTWSSSATGIATVHPGTGVVTGITAGTTIITYAMGSGCFATDTFYVGPVPSAISGPSTVCIPSMVAPVYHNDMPGGIWSSSNPGVAAIFSSTPYDAIVVGHMPGTAILTYSLCGVDVTYPISVINGLGTSITGPNDLCVGSTIDLDNLTPGGSWSSGHTGIATVDPGTGVVIGVTPGSTFITYTLPTGCFAIHYTNVNWTYPVTGPDEVCVGSTITLTHPVGGGTWSSGSGAATVNALGEVTGVSPGLAMISYSSSVGCVATPLEVLVRALPPVITGTTTICSLSTTTLYNSETGGTWSSLNTSVATITPGTGVVTAVGIGTAIIRYTNVHGCSRETVVSVISPSIGEHGDVCEGNSITLTATSPSGTWISANTAILSIGLSTGIALGEGAGTTTITYTSPEGCVATTSIEVFDNPSISGGGSFCSDGSLPLTGAPAGGTWTSSMPSRILIHPSTGVAMWGGSSTGSAVITYTMPTGCYSVETIIVDATPAAITGDMYLCTGDTTTLINTITGGVWSSSDLGIASVDGSSGLVTGNASGTATISYTMPTGCFSTSVVVVDPTPDAITGFPNLCMGIPRFFFVTPSGGTWSISDSSKVSVDSVAPTGESILLSGVSPGSVTITYTLCSNSVTFNVNVPPPISGTLQICPGYTTDLDHPISGGVWVSENPTIASVAPFTGVVTGNAVGTANIRYVVSGLCATLVTVTVNSTITTITGNLSICVHGETDLDNPVSGGTWSTAASTAAIDASTGLATGLSAGTALITYDIGVGCKAEAVLVVNPAVAPIAGTMNICENATSLLANSTPGGTWSSSASSIASIVESTGLMTGEGVGSAIITYFVSPGCMDTSIATINIMPDTISGATNVCVGSTIALGNATPGGTWTSNAPTVASIDLAGVVSGNVAGSAVITYRIADCYVTKLIVVNALPAAISGLTSVCAGSNRTLSSSSSGGSWSSSNTSVAIINPTTGLLTGMGIGTTTITYMLPTGCFTTVLFTVHPSLSAIEGPSSVCGGATISLSNSTAGGTWSESYAGILTVDASGVVTGVATGAATVTYSFSSGCYVTKTISVDAPSISGGGTGIVDVGSTLSLTGTASGGSWSASNSNATVGLSTGIVTGISGGTVIITYTRSTGCYATKQVTVCAPYTVAIEQTAPITTGADHEIAFCPGMTLQVSGAPTGATFTWSVTPTSGGVVPVSTGIPGQFSFATTPSPHTYTLTVTANAGGCKESANIVMVVNNGGCYPCDYFKPDVAGACPIVPYFKTITAPVLDGTNLGTGSTPYYFIAKNARLDVSPSPGSVFYMGYNVELTVADVIYLSGLHFYSGANTFCRWKGISVINDDPVAGGVYVDGNTLIENASEAGIQVAVGVSDDAIIPPSSKVIVSEAGIYNRNDVGIRIDHFQLSSAIVDYPFTISNNVFTNRQFNQYVDPEASSPSCSDYYPFKWPTVDYLKTATYGESGYNPVFNIDNFHGFPTTLMAGVVAINSGSTDESVTDHSDTYYDGVVYNGIVVGDQDKDELYNLFDTIITGAYVSNSNVKFYNNIFRHTPNPYPITSGSGVGIHGYQDVTLLAEKKAVQLLPGNGEHTNNRFYNCYNAFYSSSCYTFISQNSWVSATLYDATPTSIGVQNYGFRFVNTTMYGNHIMENNNFRNLYGSIVSAISSCANPYGRIRIKNNTIIDLIDSSSNEIGYYGIRLLDQSTCSPTYNSLEISDNYVQGSSWGIEVYGNSDHISSLSTRIWNNKVKVIDNGRISAWTRLGIVCRQLSNLVEVTGNTVEGDPTNGVKYNTYTAGMPNSQGLSAYTGFHFWNVNGTVASDVSCNLVKHMPIGFKFEHNNNIRWRRNVMEQNKYGLVLHSYFDAGVPTFYDGTIGQQGDTCDPMDNIWYDAGPDALTGWTSWTSTGISQTFTAGTNPALTSPLYVRPIGASTVPSYHYKPTNNNTWTITYPSTSVGAAYLPGTSIFDGTAGCTELELSSICAEGIPEDEEARGVATAVDHKLPANANAYVLTPNPTTGNIIITQKNPVTETVEVKVMNAVGQIVYSGALQFSEGNATLSLLNSTPGIYMLTMINKEGEIFSFRIIIQ